jgi:hypothetical protein
MTRLYMGCRSRFTPARDHHRLCWWCWRAETSRRREVAHDQVAAFCRDGIDFEVAYALVTELGVRIVNPER